MQILTLIIALVALVIALAALARTGGLEDLRRQVGELGPKTSGARDRTADLLDRLARRVRKPDKAPVEQSDKAEDGSAPPRPPDPV